MKILHIITGLKNGGAESSLFRLISNDKEGNDHIVISLTGMGIYGEKLQKINIRVEPLELSSGITVIKGFGKLIALLKEIRPDVVQTWMYHSDFFGGLCARLAGIENIIWGIRNTNLARPYTSAKTIYVAKTCAFLSRWIPASIVSCSHESAKSHIDFGYLEKKMVVIPNGYDLSSMKYDENGRNLIRSQFHINNDTCLLGMVARWDPLKDHENLFSALSKLQEITTAKWQCLLVGPKISAENLELVSLLEKYQLHERVILAGPTDNIRGVMSALDIHLLSSIGEAFPNVLAEAMACSTPCITTDVGDAKFIIGESGWVVPVANSEALSHSIHQAMEASEDPIFWTKRKKQCRQHIEENFGIEKMINSFNSVWHNLLNKGN